MMIFFYAILVQIQQIRCTWVRISSQLTSIKQFNNLDTDGFIYQIGNPNIPAYYLICSLQEGSYITLNPQNLIALSINGISTNSYSMYFVTYDLIFFNNWKNVDYVKYSIGSNINEIYADIQQMQSISRGFCNGIAASIQTFNITINSTTITGFNKFEISSSSGSVSIKNVIVSALQCHGSCYRCYGSKPNQCSSCFQYGTLNQNTCQYSCPSQSMYYVKNQGCKPTCYISQQKYLNGVCETYPIFNYLALYISQSKSQEQFKWQIIHDFEQLNAPLPENRLFEGFYIFGIFTYKQGIYRVLNVTNNQGSFMIAITVELIIFNKMPASSSIQFLINNTYYGQIYSDEFGQVKTDKLYRYWIDTRQSAIYNDISYTDNVYNTLYFYANVTDTFVIKIIGNFQDSNAGWGLRSCYVYSGYCPINCIKCEEKFNCLTCQNGYFKSKWGTCTLCSSSNQQKINNTHCLEDDDETIYSKYIIKEFTGLELDIEAYPEYVLISQTGQNFLKGQGIYYSVWKSTNRIFGGPFIWAQAKFQRIVNINSPHHSITISFIVVFGPTFPEDGQFIFSIDGMIQIECASFQLSEITIKHKQLHSSDNINIEMECLGTNNEPISAYCGFYQHYITIHQCKPNCNQCKDDKTCDDVQYVDQTNTCPDGQFFNLFQQQCQNCPDSCMTCTSYQNCLTCQNTFINPVQGCICAYNQFLELGQCQNCPQNCNQCVNQQKCTECVEGLFRKLINNECVCEDSYFDFNNELLCKKCIQNCIKCSQSTTCENCSTGYDLSDQGICIQKQNTYYQDTLDKFLECPISEICNPCQGIYTSCICGDMIISGTEQCEDGNQIQFDGCYNCAFSCQPQCTKCIQGICYECAIQGWYLDVSIPQNYICKEVCFDGLQVGSEQCDDALGTSNCRNCQYYCRSDCLKCNYSNGKCDECREGLIVELNYCKNKCGDGIKVSAPDINFNEECDDGNLIDFDGCSKSCQFQCQSSSICDICQTNKCLHCVNKYYLNPTLNMCQCAQSCQQCDFATGKGCFQCLPGFMLIDFECFSICGDSIVTFVEQCDDGNIEFGDGCHQCYYNCESECLQCIYGQCFSCISNYQIIAGRCQQIIDYYQIPTLIFNQIYQNDNIQYFYQDYEYNIYLNRISMESLDQKTLQHIQQNEIIYFTYLYANANHSFFQTDLQITNYLTNSQNYMYSNCFSQADTQPFNCYTFNKQEGSKINQIGDYCYSLYDNYEYCQGNGIECYYDCPKNCQICYQGSCISCQNGYNLDIIGNSCHSICGDNLIMIEEFCDDGNNLFYDGCNQCQFQCQEQCIDCQYGKCNLCKEDQFLDIKIGKCFNLTNCEQQKGFYYDQSNNLCFTKCGDSIQAGNEQCDDGNDIQYDGCFQCLHSCNKYCIKCGQQNCEQCQIGYKLYNLDCIPDCGDGIILNNEQCDDGNSLLNDGCTNCQIDQGYKCQTLDQKSFCYQCKSECSDCEFNNGQFLCLNCNKGYYLSFGECLKCSEHCEECQNTPNNCTVCIIQNCQKCHNKQGYYYDFDQKKCITKCGDGIMAGDEQCDDGNHLNQDGCNSKCLIEKGYHCIQNECNLKEEKIIEYGYPNSSTSNCLFIKSELDFQGSCTKIKINVEFFQNNEFNFSIINVQINSTNRSQSINQFHECQIQFNFFKTITEINLIHILIPITNNSSRILEEEDIKEIIITPRKQVYYNEEQKAQAQTVVSTSNKLTFLLQLIGPLTILFGGLNFFWTILDILTWINNFYFLNVDYPLNVKLFFQHLQWDDIFNIPEFISFNQPTDTYYFEAPPKFNEKNINPLLINNLQVFGCLILSAILLYIVTTTLIKIFEKMFNQKKQKRQGITVFTVCYEETNNQTQEQQQQPKVPMQEKLQKLPRFFEFIIRQSYQYKLTFLSKIISIINLLLLDIFMACILQLTCEKKEYNFMVTINNFLAILGLILIFGMYKLYEFVSSKHQLLLDHFIFQRKYLTLYEGIDFENKIAKKYCYFNLIRKIAFIISIIMLYEKPVLQTTFCCLSCFINQAFLLYQNPFDSRIGLIQTAVPDFCIFCIILISVLISLDDMTSFLSFDQKYNIGWVIISLIGLSILIQLIFLLIEFLQNLLTNLKGLKQMFCR